MARCSCKKNSRKRRVRTKKQRKMKKNSSKKYQKKRRSQRGGNMISTFLGMIGVRKNQAEPAAQGQLVPPLSTDSSTTNSQENMKCDSITNNTDCDKNTNCEFKESACRDKAAAPAGELEQSRLPDKLKEHGDGNNLGSSASTPGPPQGGKKKKKTKGKKKK